MDLLPERIRYEPGEVARFQVRSPFREATALITVEREGIVEARIQPLSGHLPVIEVPIRPGFAPNVFVSVLAVRGRVDGFQPTAIADLGKPAYRLGIAEIRVGWKEHELKVRVRPDRERYQVRETSKVSIEVVTPSGAPLSQGEIAVAAVDEGQRQLGTAVGHDGASTVLVVDLYSADASCWKAPLWAEGLAARWGRGKTANAHAL